jgi:hypothetical protein
MYSDFVPAISVSCILIIILGFIAIMRYIAYKENVLFAEKGFTRPPEQKNGKGLLRWGITITALGIAFTLGLYPIGFSSGDEYPLHLGPWMLGGFVPLFLGLGLTLLHYLTEKE